MNCFQSRCCFQTACLYCVSAKLLLGLCYRCVVFKPLFKYKFFNTILLLLFRPACHKSRLKSFGCFTQPCNQVISIRGYFKKIPIFMTQNDSRITFSTLSKDDLAQKIDHTLLKPFITAAEFERHCSSALQYHFKTICIPPSWVKQGVKNLAGSKTTGVITVVGFPLGYSESKSKAFEAELAIGQGACEIDMVINFSWIKNQELKKLEDDIRAVVIACDSIPLKVIVETAYLTQNEKLTAAKIAESAGAAFVKTSTGFASGVPAGTPLGATLADIQFFRQNLKPSTKIKASGGVRDFAMAIEMIHAGADRLGTSASVEILNGLTNEGTY